MHSRGGSSFFIRVQTANATPDPQLAGLVGSQQSSSGMEGSLQSPDVLFDIAAEVELDRLSDRLFFFLDALN